jgi:hypothetical protein
MEQVQLQPLQVFGNLKRNICSCEQCKSYCKTMPGYATYKDILNIYQYYNPAITFTNWIKLCFLASPGAIVMKGGKIFRIPTIVPARSKKTGHCIFFTPKEKCSIHDFSPFGCRYFDCKQTKEEGDKISKIGLNNIINEPEYTKIWITLNTYNLISPPPEELRKNDFEQFIRKNDFEQFKKEYMLKEYKI